MQEEKIDHIFSKHDLRKTEIRKKILDLLIQAEPSALASSDIEKSLDHVDRITLYRSLKTFEQKGIIHHAIDGSGNTKYALCEADCDEDHHKDQHAHFHCLICDQTICLDIMVQQEITLPKGYVMQNAHLVVKGTCPNCR